MEIISRESWHPSSAPGRLCDIGEVMALSGPQLRHLGKEELDQGIFNSSPVACATGFQVNSQTPGSSDLKNILK